MGSRRVCILNQRAAVGKTVTAINLGVALALAGKKTLIIDLDPGCAATVGIGREPSSRHALEAGGEVFDTSAGHDLSVLAGCRHVEHLATEASDSEAKRAQLAEVLQERSAGYEWVVVDCPSTLSWLTEVALLASNEVLVPMRCEYFALEGTPQLIQLVKRIMDDPDRQLDFSGFLLTMHEDSLPLTLKVDKEVREFFGEIVFETVIPRDSAVALASEQHSSVFDIDPRSRVARAYAELCMEVMEGE